MNFKRIYEYRFQDIKKSKKSKIWKLIGNFIYKLLDKPYSILDPAAGECEFINNVPCKEKWAIDLNDDIVKFANNNVRVIVGDTLVTQLPEKYFDAVFVSNFLEHLKNQEEVAYFLQRIYLYLKDKGKIVVMGPNFKYAIKNYFDFADHNVILTELSVSEHIYGAGFNITKIYPRFLPLSFRGRLPVNSFITKIYINIPFLWRFFGKQFLIIGEK